MKINKKEHIFTHEGARAKQIDFEQQLRRAVMSCLLWEKEFYEDGEKISRRIASILPHVNSDMVAKIVLEAKEKMYLRHIPLFIIREMARIEEHKKYVAYLLEKVIKRADELSEFLAIYWKDGRQPLSAQLKKGLARAFQKFDAYQLAKYNRGDAIRLRDVLFLCHAKPKNKEQEQLWERLVKNELFPPDTWEVGLSGGGDKCEVFTRLLIEGKLGYMAILRNLRNMADAGVDRELINRAILARNGAERVLPFRYVAAAMACPQFEPAIDKALVSSIEFGVSFPGKTVVLVDVSGSMEHQISLRSDMTRMDAAASLASIIQGQDVRVFTFSEKTVEVPHRVGMAGVDVIIRSQPHMCTYLGACVKFVNDNIHHDRIIVITDEQSHDAIPDPVSSKAYMINIASNENGVGYGRWTHIDGWSENVLRFIHNLELLARNK